MRLLELEDAFPIPLHVDDRPSIRGCCIQGRIQPTKGRVAVIGVFAFPIGVMDDQPETAAACQSGPLEHLKIAIGIAECGDRAPPDVLVDADRLAGLSSIK